LPVEEEESAEYGAYTFVLNGQHIRFRVAKITPTKIGQFVTLWKRVGKGPIQPFDQSDPIDFFIISVRKGDSFGQFVFPKAILLKHGVISKHGKGGKRAIRVYPPWDHPTSLQAMKSQMWQVEYFLRLNNKVTLELPRIQHLYSEQAK
jgi:hypothetical protein